MGRENVEVAGSRRPAGETLWGHVACGDWGNFFLSTTLLLQCCSLMLPPYAGALWGALWGEGFHSFQTTPLWLLPHCFPPLHPPTSPTYRIQAVDGPDGVIDALTSAWDGQLGAGRLALAGWAGARRIFLMPLPIFLFPCSRMRVAASGAATWVLSRYIGPVRPQTLCR